MERTRIDKAQVHLNIMRKHVLQKKTVYIQSAGMYQQISGNWPLMGARLHINPLFHLVILWYF